MVVLQVGGNPPDAWTSSIFMNKSILGCSCPAGLVPLPFPLHCGAHAKTNVACTRLPPGERKGSHGSFGECGLSL